MRALNALFGEAFDDSEHYGSNPPGDAYLEKILGNDSTIVLAVLENEQVVGGLVAYELEKLESERSEIYVFDLAVAAAFRRRGIATELVHRLREIAKERGAAVIFVQADHDDEPAIALYEKLGVRKEALHFDIEVL
jgi:aminoglycoside 3-N-acetyltransferase I